MWQKGDHASVGRMDDAPVLLEVDGRGIAKLTLNRPARGNAYDGALLAALAGGLDQLATRTDLRALVIRGEGKHFQAGADLDWLAAMAKEPPAAAYAASMATIRTMQMLNEFPRPTLAVVHGACFGGGCGLVCSVDIALATPNAVFGLTEVRVGVAPTPISVEMVQAMGLRHTRRYALTGERFDAAEAMRIGLVHEIVLPERLDERLAEILEQVMLGAPGAIALTKRSFLEANNLLIDAPTRARLAEESCHQRASAEGREGLASFREQRHPAWYRPA
ncbi:MAG: enoyl-CoA hydratase-related protein [Acetobacteraceae bacterium]